MVCAEVLHAAKQWPCRLLFCAWCELSGASRGPRAPGLDVALTQAGCGCKRRTRNRAQDPRSCAAPTPTLPPPLETVLFRPQRSCQDHESETHPLDPVFLSALSPLFLPPILSSSHSKAHRCDEVSCCPQQIARATFALNCPH